MFLDSHLHPIVTVGVEAFDKLDEHICLQLEKVLARTESEISDVGIDQFGSLLVQILHQMLDYFFTLVLLGTSE